MKKTTFCNKGVFSTLAIAALLGCATSCSDEVKEPAVTPDDNTTEASVLGASVNVITDAATLSQYVTNYKTLAGRAGALSRAAEDNVEIFDEWPTYDATGAVELTMDEYGNTNIDTSKSTTYIISAGNTITLPGWSVNFQNGPLTVIVEGTINSNGGAIYLNGSNVMLVLGKTGSISCPVYAQNNAQIFYDCDLTINGDYSLYSSLYVTGKLTVTGTLQMSGTGDGCVLAVGSLSAANVYDLQLFDIYVNDAEGNLGAVTIAGELKMDNAGYPTINAASLSASSLTTNNNTLNIAGAVKFSGNVDTNNTTINAATLEIGGNWTDINNGTFTIDEYIKVAGDNQINAQSVITTPCYIVSGDMEIVNAATLNVSDYIKAGTLTCDASGWKINMGKSALIDAGDYLLIKNKGYAINFDNNEAYPSLITAEEIRVMEGQIGFITGYASIMGDIFTGKYEGETWCGEEVEMSTFQESNTNVTVGTGYVISDGTGCKPDFNIEPGDPYIEEISKVEDDHSHDTSATCVFPYNNKVYVSWQKRGTAIHGCIEALQINGETTEITSYMETEDGTTEGGNNWDGNSSDKVDADMQGEYDFNHLIAVNENGTDYIVTVGDHAKKGGFLGALAVGADGDFGKTGTREETDGKFVARGLFPNEAKGYARSGNCVVYNGSKYMVACAGGYQEYTDPIAELGKIETYATSGTSYFVHKLGASLKTAGSAKHLALNSDKSLVAMLEYTADAGKDAALGDYWFNDNVTKLPAKLSVKKVDNWLDEASEWSVEIPEYSPIYGKNVIQFDGENVYVSEGINGIAVYNRSGLIDRFKIADYDAKLAAKYKDAAVNGLYVDSQYIYVAYGASGLWILDKENMEPVCQPWNNASASANYVAVQGDKIIVAYGKAGVKVFQLKNK